MIFEHIDNYGHEQVVFCHNKDAGLKAIIAIHNTVLGPALGGLRMWPYKTEQDALNDVLRLSRGMTYKNAVAGLNIGGGKAVIIGDPSNDKSEALFRAFGKFVDSLGGRYITAEDVGIDVNDMEYVYRETEYVTGVHQVHGGSGDPSPFTAYGTLQGLMATLNKKYGDEEVGRHSYAVQGLGHVGMEFVKLLKERGAKIFVTDINKALVEQAVERIRRRSGRPGRNLRRAGRCVFAVRARRHRQRADAAAPEGQDHLRRGQQPAGQQRDRRRSAETRHRLCTGLRGQRRRRDERVAGNRRLQPRARDADDAHDLSQPRAASTKFPTATASRPIWPPTVWPKNASPRSAS